MSGGATGLISDAARSVRRGLRVDAVATGRFLGSLVGALVAAFVVAIVVIIVNALYGIVHAVLGSVLPAPNTVEGVTNSAIAIVLLLGPPAYIANYLTRSLRDVDPITARPGAVLFEPAVVLLAGLGAVISVGTTTATMGVLVLGGFLLVVRTTVYYARTVRTLSPPWWGLAVLIGLSMLPVSFVAGIEQALFVSDLVGADASPPVYSDTIAILSSLGVPDGVSVGAATFSALDLVVAGAPIVCCGGYLLAQSVASVPRRQSGHVPGRPQAVQERLERARETRREGDAMREQGSYGEAIDRYDRAKTQYERITTGTDEEYERRHVERIRAETDSLIDDAAAVLEAAVGPHRERATERYAEAQSHREAGDDEAAVEACEAAITATDEGIDTFENLTGRMDDLYTSMGEDTSEIIGDLERIRGEVDAVRADAETALREADVAEKAEEAERRRTEAAEAADGGDLDAALSAYRDARSLLDDAVETAGDAGLDREAELRDRRAAVDERIDEVETRIARADVDALLSDAREQRRTAEQRRSDGDFQAAVERFEEAAGSVETAVGRCEDNGLDDRRDDASALRAEIEREVEATREDAARERVAGTRDRINERAAAAASHHDDGTYDDAIEAYDDAIDLCADAIEVAADADLDVESELGARRMALREARTEVERDRALDSAAAAVETGDERFEAGAEHEATGEKAASEGAYDEAIGAYGDAVAAFEAATTAYDEALDGLQEYDAEEQRSAARRKRTQATERRASANLSRLAQRINAAQARIETEPETARESFADVLADIDDQRDSLDRPEDLSMLESEAEAGRVRARLAEARARVESAIEEYEAEAYAEALSAFESTAEFLESTEPVAAGEDESEERDRLLDLCEENAAAARRARFSIGDEEPTVRSPEAVGEAQAADTEVEQQLTSTDGSAAATASPGVEVDEAKFANSPPEHERLEQIGAGGSANVYRVRLADSGAVAAFKEPKRQGTMDRSVVESFAEEAAFWTQLSDGEEIVALHDWGVQPAPWMLLEYMEGGTLADRVGSVTLSAGVDALVDVCEAVRYAHRRAGYHTDLKPENVLFTERDGRERAKVGDWGLARTPFATGDRFAGATPAYAAPEQIDPETYGSVGPHTDIYQVGVLAYELFTGRQPFGGDTPHETTRAVLASDPTPPGEIDGSLPAALDRIVRTAMAPNPDERYDSVVYIRDELRALVDR